MCDDQNDNSTISDKEDEVLALEINKIYSKLEYFKSIEDEVEEPAPSNKAGEALKICADRLDAAPATASNVIALNKMSICILKKMELSIKRQIDAIDSLQIHYSRQLAQLQTSRNKGAISGVIGSYLKCGMPFFKTSEGTCQQNNEYKRIHEKLRYISPESFFKVPRIWSANDIQVLCESVRSLSLKEFKYSTDKLSNASARLKSIKNRKFDSDLEEYNWWSISEKLNISHGMCREQWLHHCNYKINRCPWSTSETKRLIDLSQRQDCKDWDLIACELGTQRTALACCSKFHKLLHMKPPQWLASDTIDLVSLFAANAKVWARPRVRIGYYYNNTPHQHIHKRIITFRSTREMENLLDTLKGFGQNNKRSPMGLSYENFAKISLKKNELERTFSPDEDRILIEAVKEQGENWDEIAESIPGRKASSLHKRYLQLVTFGKSVLDLFACEKNESRLIPTDPIDVWSVLQLMWEGNTQSDGITRYGLKFGTKSTAASQLCKHLQYGHVHLFGPRFGVPRTEEKKRQMAITFSAVAQSLKMKYDLNSVIAKVQTLNLGSPECNIAYVADFPESELPKMFGTCFVPPNVLTLVGLRTLLCSRGHLTGQSTLSIKYQRTKVDPTVDEADRMSTSLATQLLKKRMFSLFYFSFCLSKIPQESCEVTPTSKENVKEKLRKIRNTSLKPSKVSRKKLAVQLNMARWGKETAGFGSAVIFVMEMLNPAVKSTVE